MKEIVEWGIGIRLKWKRMSDIRYGTPYEATVALLNFLAPLSHRVVEVNCGNCTFRVGKYLSSKGFYSSKEMVQMLGRYGEELSKYVSREKRDAFLKYCEAVKNMSFDTVFVSRQVQREIDYIGKSYKDWTIERRFVREMKLDFYSMEMLFDKGLIEVSFTSLEHIYNLWQLRDIVEDMFGEALQKAEAFEKVNKEVYRKAREALAEWIAASRV